MATAKMAPEFLSTLQARLAQARCGTDGLFTLLREGALHDRPIPERHRLIFYLGHVEAFDWNLLGRGTLELPSFHPEFDKLFAFGIDPVDGKLPNEPASAWPKSEEVRRYNARVREKIDAALSESSEKLPQLIVDGTLLNVAIEHRLMHAETLAYLFHQLSYEKKKTADIKSRGNPEDSAHANGLVLQGMCGVPAGEATLGILRGNGDGFGWDNEFAEHRVRVPEFCIREFPVTNGEFLEFMRSGGYEEKSLWSAEDCEWKNAAGISHPLFWARNGEDWEYRGMFAQFPLPLNWPVYVSHAEAAAFARWMNQSLPTEAQWHRAAYGALDGEERQFPWGDDAPDAERGNFDFHHWDATAVGTHPAGQSAFGAQDLLGNGWEWTATPFGAFPGFEPFSFYPGYSANFFDGKHFVMKGGSSRTAACMLRRSFRNWFQPHYPYVYAKFRTVEV
ncbi:MAG TPA: SUMF1/EgtB/PvdO family nonheme iron enzyme [Candidatus Acidoferrales bacterium]|nr:SUMF1/EgtB/PvdO family nonheme iron enzyme [Candidatus Acidoferrales bacterium]